MAELPGKVIVATPDPQLITFLSLCQNGASYFLGSEDDVLSRVYQAANGANTIVRITADCPLIDPKLIDMALNYFFVSELSYLTNRPSFPDGMDVEVMSTYALEMANREAISPYDREHVTSYIQDHPERFQLGKMVHDTDLSHYHWSVDTPEDLTFVRQVYEKLGDYFTLDDVLFALGAGILEGGTK